RSTRSSATEAGSQPWTSGPATGTGTRSSAWRGARSIPRSTSPNVPSRRRLARRRRTRRPRSATRATTSCRAGCPRSSTRSASARGCASDSSGPTWPRAFPRTSGQSPRSRRWSSRSRLVRARARSRRRVRGVLGLRGLVPASDLALVLTNRGVVERVRPAPLAKLALRDGVPADLRTMIVVPTLLTSAAAVSEQIAALEMHYLANPDDELRFALVSDWMDATAETTPDDDELLAAATDGIARLNLRHGQAPDGQDRFFLFHRRRTWNAREAVWMGWERKRGKLDELNRLLRGATDTSFLTSGSASANAPANVRYVITLDGDTRLPSGAARKLVGAMAHPLNRPRFDSASRRVIAGYGLLQPRVSPTLPED